MADDLGVIETPLTPVLGPNRERPFTERLWDQTASAFSLENMTAASLQHVSAPDAANYNPNFDLFSKLNTDEQLNFEYFTGANSDRDVEFFREKRAKEQQLRETLRDGPLPEWLIGTVASVADLPTFLPIMGPLGKGRGVAQGAFAVGAPAVAGAVAQEAVLQNLTRSRTLEEGAASVILSSVFGTGLGAFFNRAGKGLVAAAPPAGATEDLTAMLRLSGLGDEPVVTRSLLQTSGLSTILKANDAASKPFSLGVLPVPKSLRDISDSTTLELAMASRPGLFDDVAAAEARVAGLQARISAVEANALEAALDPVMQAAAVRPGNALPGLQRELAIAETERSLALTKAWDAAYATQQKVKAIDGKMTPEGHAHAVDELLQARERWQAAAEADQTLVNKTFGDVLKGGRAPDLPRDPLAFLDGIAERALQNMKAAEAKAPKPADGKDIPDKLEAKSLSAGGGGFGPHQLGASDWASQLANSFGMLTLVNQLRRVRLAPTGIELGMSPFANTRRLAQMISNHGLVTKGEIAGIPSPQDLATRTKVTAAPYYQARDAAKTAFKEHKQAGGTLSYTDFMEEVGRAMSRGDVHPDATVAKAAAHYRALDDALYTEAKAVGAIKEDLGLKGTAKSHFPRRPIEAKILSRRTEFRDLLARWYEINDTAGKATSRQDYRDAAEQVIDDYLKSPAGRMPAVLNMPGARGSLKERTHLIPDDFEHNGIRFDDFMDKNAERVMLQMTNTMASDIEFYRLFPDGEKSFTEHLQALKDEWKAVADKAPNEAAKLRISRQGDKDENMLKWLLERTRGTQSQPVSPVERGLNESLRNVRTGVSMLRLGTTIASQLADLGKVALEEGFTRTFGPLMADMVTGFKGIKISMAEAKRAGTALDLDTSATARAIADLGDPYAPQWKITRGMDAAAHGFFVASLMSPWQAAIKSHIARLSIDRMIRDSLTAAQGGALSTRRQVKLAEAGIGPQEIKLLAAQADKFEKHQGLYLANTEKWTDQEAVQAFRAGIYRGVTNGMITPTAIDKPTLVQDFPTIFQFRSFGFGSIGRLMVRSLQFHDAQALSAVVTAIGMGAMGLALRDIVSHGKIDEKRTTGQWITDAIDRSGIMWMFFEADALMDKFTAGQLSAVRSIAGDQTTRSNASSAVSRVLGPSVGLLADASTAGQNAARGEFTQSDLHKLVSVSPLGPLHSLLWTRYVFGQLEKSVGQGMGLSERENRRGSGLP